MKSNLVCATFTNWLPFVARFLLFYPYTSSILLSDYESPMQLGSAELFLQESKSLVFGNGNDKPPTGFMFEKQQMHGLYFNQSPAKVLTSTVQTLLFFKINNWKYEIMRIIDYHILAIWLFESQILMDIVVSSLTRLQYSRVHTHSPALVIQSTRVTL